MRISTPKLEKLMVNGGFSLSDLAELSGINLQSLGKIRRRQSCQIGTAGKLCAALGCRAEDIMPDEQPERDAR